MDIDINDNEVLCFFNFRSPYAYVGIKKALELDITPKFVPFCYVPKEIFVDCNWPSVHAAWSEVNKEGKGLDFMLKIFEARFKKGLNVGDKSIITNICNEIEISPELALSAMDNEDIDKDLKSLTKLMRELKVFGVPTFIYKKERFWGQDRLNYLKNILDK